MTPPMRGRAAPAERLLDGGGLAVRVRCVVGGALLPATKELS